MIALLDFDTATGILLVYQTGQRTEDDAGNDEAMLEDKVREVSPRAFLYVMDHAQWDVSEATWMRLLTNGADLVGSKPVAMVMPVGFPDEQMAMFSKVVAAREINLQVFPDEEAARTWLIGQTALRG